jgi:hypothetical protein
MKFWSQSTETRPVHAHGDANGARAVAHLRVECVQVRKGGARGRGRASSDGEWVSSSQIAIITHIAAVMPSCASDAY